MDDCSWFGLGFCYDGESCSGFALAALGATQDLAVHRGEQKVCEGSFSFAVLGPPLALYRRIVPSGAALQRGD